MILVKKMNFILMICEELLRRSVDFQEDDATKEVLFTYLTWFSVQLDAIHWHLKDTVVSADFWALGLQWTVSTGRIDNTCSINKKKIKIYTIKKKKKLVLDIFKENYIIFFLKIESSFFNF